MYTIIVGKLIALLAQSAIETARFRAPKDNFDAKRIPIVRVKPIDFYMVHLRCRYIK